MITDDGQTRVVLTTRESTTMTASAVGNGGHRRERTNNNRRIGTTGGNNYMKEQLTATSVATAAIKTNDDRSLHHSAVRLVPQSPCDSKGPTSETTTTTSRTHSSISNNRNIATGGNSHTKERFAMEHMKASLNRFDHQPETTSHMGPGIGIAAATKPIMSNITDFTHCKKERLLGKHEASFKSYDSQLDKTSHMGPGTVPTTATTSRNKPMDRFKMEHMKASLNRFDHQPETTSHMGPGIGIAPATKPIMSNIKTFNPPTPAILPIFHLNMQPQTISEVLSHPETLSQKHPIRHPQGSLALPTSQSSYFLPLPWQHHAWIASPHRKTLRQQPFTLSPKVPHNYPSGMPSSAEPRL
jgi:hypothetical protein